MIVSARPYPAIKQLTQSKDGVVNDMGFYPLGRDSLLSGLVALGLQRGDGIIVPAYMCNSTIQPLQASGFDIVYIDVDKDLRLPVDVVKSVIASSDSIKVLLAVHYFGFTKDIDAVSDLCREYGVKVVEDASHSFLSQFLRDRSDIKGDMENFSMRKSLPIVDGGALRINNGGCNLTGGVDSLCVSMLSDIKYLILRLLERMVTGLGVNIYGRFINNIKNKLRSKISAKECERNIEACQPSWQLKKYLSNEEYLLYIQHKVVGNFNQLSQALQGIGFDLLVESVEDGTIPQACVVYDNRGGLVDYLRSSGIGAWQWPGDETPKEVAKGFKHYPNALFLDKRLVLLPVHQSIGKRQINYMIKVLSGWKL